MGRSRYTITEAKQPHFLTCTIVEWLPVFTRTETVEILLNSWTYLRINQGLKLYGYVVLENHIHWIAQAPALDQCVKNFKSFTARQIIDYLKAKQVKPLLKKLAFAKKAHKTNATYQFWQEGSHAELILNEQMMREKLDYIHFNPVKRGYIDKPEDWRYSSARFYMGQDGLIEIDKW